MSFTKSLRGVFRELLCLRGNHFSELWLHKNCYPNKTLVINGVVYKLYVSDIFVMMYLGADTRGYVFVECKNDTYCIIVSSKVLAMEHLNTMVRIKANLYDTGHYKRKTLLEKLRFVLIPYRLERYRVADYITAIDTGAIEVIDTLNELLSLSLDSDECVILRSRIIFMYETLYRHGERSIPNVDSKSD